jgi:hypothetical protein
MEGNERFVVGTPVISVDFFMLLIFDMIRSHFFGCIPVRVLEYIANPGRRVSPPR